MLESNHLSLPFSDTWLSGNSEMHSKNYKTWGEKPTSEVRRHLFVQLTCQYISVWPRLMTLKSSQTWPLSWAPDSSKQLYYLVAMFTWIFNNHLKFDISEIDSFPDYLPIFLFPDIPKSVSPLAIHNLVIFHYQPWKSSLAFLCIAYDKAGPLAYSVGFVRYSLNLITFISITVSKTLSSHTWTTANPQN